MIYIFPVLFMKRELHFLIIGESNEKIKEFFTFYEWKKVFVHSSCTMLSTRVVGPRQINHHQDRRVNAP